MYIKFVLYNADFLKFLVLTTVTSLMIGQTSRRMISSKILQNKSWKTTCFTTLLYIFISNKCLIKDYLFWEHFVGPTSRVSWQVLLYFGSLLYIVAHFDMIHKLYRCMIQFHDCHVHLFDSVILITTISSKTRVVCDKILN